MKVLAAVVMGFAAVSILSNCTMPEEPQPSPPREWTQALGASCVRNSDCATGMSCDRSAPAGSCYKPCSRPEDCGNGAVCSEDKCMPACNTPVDCRAGFECSGKAAKFCRVIDEPEENTA